ncbi:hypothetical protein ACEN8I_09095 [Polaromonas sp. CT11-55]
MQHLKVAQGDMDLGVHHLHIESRFFGVDTGNTRNPCLAHEKNVKPA